MRAFLALLSIAGIAHAAPTRTVAGRRLPLLASEPAFDEGTFVAAAGSRLAQTYRTPLVATTLDVDTREALGVDTLPAGLFVVRIRRDRSGKRYLYRPCDQGHHQRLAITATQVFTIAPESLVVPIARTTQHGRITTYELDTKGLSPMVAAKLRLRRTSTAGQFELAVGDADFTELVATPAAAAKLDVVVRVCKTARVGELDFDR